MPGDFTSRQGENSRSSNKVIKGYVAISFDLILHMPSTLAKVFMYNKLG